MCVVSDADIERASRNYENQERLFAQIRDTTWISAAEIADDLGTTVEEAQSALNGERDLTLTELRYLANAAGLTIAYRVSDHA